MQVSWNTEYPATVSSLLPVNKDVHITPLFMVFLCYAIWDSHDSEYYGYTVLDVMLCSLVEM